MAKRIAQVDIKIGGINNISSMEKELAKMNEEVKELDVNSKAFKKMSSNIAELEGKLKATNNQLEGVTSTEKAEGVLKMGEGFAGALIGVQGLSMALGGTNEELEKTIQKVGGLILAMDGLRRVTEAFSAENMKRIRGVGRTFTTLAKTVKASSLAMRSALIATGIGALVVAVGLLIANWEKLTKWVGNKGREKQLKKEVKQYEMSAKATDAKVAGLEKEAGLRAELATYTDDELGAAQAAFDAINYKIVQQRIEIDNHKKLVKLAEMELEKRKEGSKKYKQAVIDLNILVAETKSLNSAYDLTGKQLSYIWQQLKSIDEVTDNKEQIRQAENLLKLLGGKEFVTKRIYETNLKNLDLQIQALILQKNTVGELKKADRDAIEALEAQRTAMIDKEAIRIRDLKLAYKEITRGKDYETIQRNIGIQMETNTIAIEEQLMVIEDMLIVNEAMYVAKEKEFEFQSYIAEEQIRMHPFDKIGLEILQKRLGLRSDEIKMLEEFEGIQINVSNLSLATKLVFHDKIKAMRELNDFQLANLEVERESYEININNLKLQQNLQQGIIDAANNRKKIVEVENEIYIANLANAKTLEEQVHWKTKIEGLDAEILTLEDAALDATNEIAILDTTIHNEKIMIANVDADILANNKEREESEAKITYEIEQQVRLSSRLKTFITEYNAEIQASQQLIAGSFELWATFYDRRAEMMQREHDDAMDNISDIDDALSDQADMREDWEELLKDANAERYDEIMAALNNIGEAETDLNDKRKMWDEKASDAAYAKAKAEWDAAKVRKAQAIIDASIQAALSFIEALPNPVLAALVAGLSLASIATIVAQPLPEKPNRADFAEGGHTGDGDKYEVAGLVHKGEYVIPQDIVDSRSGAEMIGVLEAMRMGMKGYAEGGSVAPVNNDKISISQDFSILAEQIAESLRINPSVVSVVEITDKQNRVKVIESNASF